MDQPLFDSPEDHTDSEPFTDRRRPPAADLTPKQAQADRLRTLMGEGYTVRVGGCGVTVFDLNPYGK
jgi:hypothetical protein